MPANLQNQLLGNRASHRLIQNSLNRRYNGAERLHNGRCYSLSIMDVLMAVSNEEKKNQFSLVLQKNVRGQCHIMRALSAVFIQKALQIGKRLDVTTF